MKKYVLSVLALLLCAAVALAASEAIIVDGNGIGTDHIITDDSSSSSGSGTSTSGSGSGSYATATPIPASGSGTTTYITPPPDDEEDPDATKDPSKWEYESTVFTAVWQGQTCEVVALGQYMSTIKTADGTTEVYTRELTWDTDAPEGYTLAVINAPNSGYVRLRKKASSNSNIIYRCQTGRVVPVLALTKNKKYAQIHYEDATGWVLSSALTFVSPAVTNGKIGYIAYKGNAKSGEPIKVRQKPSSAARVLDEIICGQRVTMLETEDKWTRIEAGNLQCWIMSSFLTTLTDEQAESLPRRGTTAQIFMTSIANGQAEASEEQAEETSGSTLNTAEPTVEPTPEPTAEPTLAPTAEPTPEPTATPVDWDHSSTYDALEQTAGYGAD